jgi:ligand-binding SRPBCC domain-containing protein
MIYKLSKETVVDTTLERAWEFIRNPANLNRMAPEDMRFTIVSDIPEEMSEGMRIEYRVRIPFLGRRKWISELRDIAAESSFVDVQLTGPYKSWHHFHSIERVGNGIRFIDRVTYEMPFGLIGCLAHALFVGRTLERIFSFREQRLHELLAGPKRADKEKMQSA